MVFRTILHPKEANGRMALEVQHRDLLEAVAFAARAHRHQQRKDGKTPYVSHVFRVCLIVRHLFGIEDPRALAAAVLHDTIEDTNTDFDDVAQSFGSEVASWVALLSKDKRLQEEAREAAYCDHLHKAPWQVKICKLADVLDNLLDAHDLNADQRARTLQRARSYLETLGQDLPQEAYAAHALVRGVLEGMEAG